MFFTKSGQSERVHRELLDKVNRKGKAKEAEGGETAGNRLKHW